MKFWANKPITAVCQRQELLAQISQELDQSTIKMDYVIMNFADLTNSLFKEVCKFINHTYDYDDNSYKLVYSEELIKYFLQDQGILCLFYPRNTKTLVGLICGSKTTLIVDKNVVDTIEINFLCIIKQLRNLHASSFMINVLTKYCLETFPDLQGGIYTIGKQIHPKHYCEKAYYHMPVNLSKLQAAKFCFKQNVVFNDLYKMTELNNASQQCKQYIYNSLCNFQQSAFTVYANISFSEFNKSFNNKAFRHFAVLDSNGAVTDYFCFYSLDTLYKPCAISLNSGYLYWYFTNKNIYKMCECIALYCNPYDILTIMDSPDLDIKDKQLLRGSSTLYYYAYNLQIPILDAAKNGLVTI